ncbi:CubicO group peptidase, beta-lactamase class C family [Alteromonadaceae bacterium Bs31]|nr:CubicO group peptidase, beta-lactamase class C family [Alteromonadaceae bacterium Bs31]
MKPLISILLLISILGCERVQTDNHEITIESAIDHYADKLLKDSRFHSVSIGVYKGGESLTKHYGELEIGKGNAPTDQSFYELGSVTKIFTGMLAAKAVLDKKIGLDDDVRKYLHKDYPNLEFNGSPVRIKHLLTHTSNFPNFPIKGDNKAVYFEGLDEIDITSEPGSEYFYSNTAPELTAFILETVYEKPYDDLLQEFILNAQNMNDTAFVSDIVQLVKGYNGDGELMPNFERKLWGGAVGLNSTASDLLKFIKLQLDDSNDVVSESHKNLFQINKSLSVGYHWYISKEGNTLRYSHHGGIYGMQNWLVIYPEYDIGISVISNASFDGVGDSLEKVATGIFGRIK